jgi:hypothetical protein
VSIVKDEWVDDQQAETVCTCWLAPELKIVERRADDPHETVVELVHQDESCPLWPRSSVR